MGMPLLECIEGVVMHLLHMGSPNLLLEAFGRGGIRRSTTFDHIPALQLHTGPLQLQAAALWFVHTGPRAIAG